LTLMSLATSAMSVTPLVKRNKKKIEILGLK